MAMTIYQSTDASAPVLNGVVGGAYSSGWASNSLLNLLNQVLVNGYGTQPAAGWTLSYSGTSEGTFKQGSGCGFFLHVLDDASLTAGAREASFAGSETATAVWTGTNFFPTSTQQATYLKFRKSDTADSTARPWICFADNKTFYLFCMPQTGTQYLAAMHFGNFHSFVANDAYNCMAVGRVTTATSDTVTNETLDLLNYGVSTATAGHYVARAYSQLGTSIAIQKIVASLSTSNNVQEAMGSNSGLAIPFPNPSDQTLMLSHIYLWDATTAPANSIRGYLRGLWTSQQLGSVIPFNYTFNGTGSLSGKTFAQLGLRTGNAANGRYIMETSNTWDS